MKKIVTVAAVFLALIFCIFNTSRAQDGFFSDARTLQSGQFKLGIQPIVFTESDNFMLMFRGAYGLQSDLSIAGKIGLFDDRDTYIGGHFKYQLAGEPTDPLSFSVIGGVYSFTDIGLKFSGILSKNLNALSLYSGLSYEPLFGSNNTLNAFMLPVGVEVPFATQSSITLEGDIAVNDDGLPYQAITFGMNFYF
ncbi:MAG TPA: hypothetical protein VJ964_16315 [Balneolaceae bacterium]|nr:hypothetical protein [Balneolaceae bacterium]